VWAQIISHSIFLSTHKSTYTADMAVLIWCILTEQPLNLSRHIQQAMGHVQIAGNLPFPALVSDLVSAVGVPYRAGDITVMIPRTDQYVPNGKYIRQPAPSASQPAGRPLDTPPPSTPPSSTPQEPSTHQMFLQILERFDRQDRRMEQMERRNKRRYNYLKELIIGTHPPLAQTDTPDSPSSSSTGSLGQPDSGGDASSPTLLLTDDTEDRAKP